MNTQISVTALVLVTSMIQFTEGQRVNAGCSCQAVDSEIPTMLLKNFGVVKTCTGLRDCSCNAVADGNIQTCRSVCEEVVAMWALNECPMMLQGREVRAQFQSPSCTNAIGIMTKDCGVRQCICPCPKPVMFSRMQMPPMQPMQQMQQMQVMHGHIN